jgi:hypothetical protein
VIPGATLQPPMGAAMSVFDTLSVELRRSRPPTAVYPDRHEVAQYREQEFPATAAGWLRVFVINLEGGFFAPGALKDMILPVAQAIRSGAYGSAVLAVVSSDDGTVEFLEALAERHDLPLFILPFPDAPLSAARPVGALTTTETQTLTLLRRDGGEVTSSRVASLAGIELNAAVNRLSGLVRKGYIHRVSRPRREGDAFIDPLLAAEHRGSMTSHPHGIPASGGDFDVPEDVRAGVRMLAAMQGSEPGELLLQAWQEFIARHQDVLAAESEQVREMLRKGDVEGLTSYANRYARERAEEASSRLKR